VRDNGAAGANWQGTGRQRLAEVIFYGRALSDAERAQNENYLARKWGLLGVRGDVENPAAVHVAAGATLDCGGTNQYVAAISGGAVVYQAGRAGIPEEPPTPRRGYRNQTSCRREPSSRGDYSGRAVSCSAAAGW
jgi:hypothetical protein